MAFNYSRLHTPTNAIRPPCVCILIILLGILRQTPLPPPPHTNAAVTMATQSGSADVRVSSKDTRAGAGSGDAGCCWARPDTQAQNGCSLRSAERAGGFAACVLFLLLPLFDSKDEEEAPQLRWNFGIRLCGCASRAPRRALVGWFPQLASSNRAVFLF